MNRRQFVTTSAIAAAVTTATGTASSASGKRQFLEMRRYQTLFGSKKDFLNSYLENAAIPALNRLGIAPVGVFTVMFGQQEPTLYVLLPHPSMESVVETPRKLLEDKEHLEKGADFLNASMSDPSYVRMESSLMLAFSQMPAVEVPESIKGKSSRLFELRTYESHSEIKAKKKIEMFNEGGEILIFRDTKLNPVFFGETLIGERLPNLNYMLGFVDMDDRDASWDRFRDSDGWKELRVKEEYQDTVCNISDIILRPASFSQI